MLVPNNPFLVGDGDRDNSIFVQNDTLATQSAFKARVDGAIDEIFFFVGDCFQKFIALLHIEVAGGTSANAPAIVVQVDIEGFGKFQNGLVFKIARNGLGGNGFIFK